MSQPNVVLFNHPGEEHKAKLSSARFAWNTGKHRRKYLAVQAQVALAVDSGFKRDPVARRVGLWGEFEPPTNGYIFSSSSRPGEPHSWHELLPIGTPPQEAQNTDPWIFGEAFRYGFCRQNSINYLRSLQDGDLLLFGSYLKQDEDGEPVNVFNFFLDTAFVVERGFPFARESDIPGALLDATYRRGAFSRFERKERDVCTFYEGTMLSENPMSKPFSFSPCSPWEAGSAPPRIRRPMIGMLFGKSFRNGQVFTRIGVCTPLEAWHRIVDHCRERRYELAVKVADPGIERGSTDGDIGASCGVARASGRRGCG
jgi:hypothetical protein